MSPFPRYHLRTLMLVVAAVAVALTEWRRWTRLDDFVALGVLAIILAVVPTILVWDTLLYVVVSAIRFDFRPWRSRPTKPHQPQN
jgi:hypothetical protein